MQLDRVLMTVPLGSATVKRAASSRPASISSDVMVVRASPPLSDSCGSAAYCKSGSVLDTFGGLDFSWTVGVFVAHPRLLYCAISNGAARR